MQKIIFTDLDGTLLDNKYSFQKAKEALKIVKWKKIPLIICSSKTRSEIENYRRKLNNKEPFISENGGGIFIPKNYFNFKFKYDKKDKAYYIIELGASYNRLVNILKKIKEKYEIIGFNDMSAKEISKDCGLSLKEAKLAKKREYDETFKIVNKKDETSIFREIKRNKLRYTKTSRYYHITGKNDKGKAVKILKKLFIKKLKKIRTISIGESENDFDMLENTDAGYLVQQEDSSYASDKYKKIKGIGPMGWSNMIKKEIT